MRPATDVTTLQVWSRPSTYDEYRGVIRVRLGTTGPTANVVNELPLETYLRGVIPAALGLATYLAVVRRSRRGCAAR